MRHYDPDDPVWNEDEEREAAHVENFDDDLTARIYNIIGLLRQGEVVTVFTTAEGVNITINRAAARPYLQKLHEDGEAEIEIPGWAL